MQRNVLRIVIFNLVFVFSLNAFAAEKYTLDPMHSFVTWHINHFGFSNPSGKWVANGTLLLDEKNPQNSKVTATITVANVVTGIPALDKHLQQEMFFDVAKYPTATFVSKKVNVTGKDTANVEGILTLHGVSKPVTLNVKLNKSGVNPVNDKMTVGFTASTKIKRSDFDITAFSNGLGDEVIIDIEAEANK